MEHDDAASAILTVGVLLVVAVAARWVAARTRIPRVSLLLLVGVIAGPLVFDALPSGREDWFPVVSRIALVMVGFLIGGEFTIDRVRRRGRQVGFIALGQGVVTAAVVAIGLLAVGVDPTVALLLGGAATATDPAATRSVIEDEEASGEGAETVLGIVALDDVIGIVTFSILLTIAGISAGGSATGDALLEGVWEIGGGLLVGTTLGLLAAPVTGRLRPGEPTLEEALGLVFIAVAVTWWLDVSYLIAAVSMGVAIANAATHHTRPFRAIESIEWPFLILFFVLAGAAIDADALESLGAVVAYVVFRTVGKTLGAGLAGRLGGLDRQRARWVGVALLPQAGVALGMALAAAERFPQYRTEIVGVAVVSTVVFELVGPFGVRAALRRME